MATFIHLFAHFFRAIAVPFHYLLGNLALQSSQQAKNHAATIVHFTGAAAGKREASLVHKAAVIGTIAKLK